MAALTSKWISAISTLNELTQSNRLKWQVEPVTAAGSARHRVVFGVSRPTAAYQAKYKDKWFRLTHTQSQGFPTSVTFGEATFVLEIVDDAGNTLFTVPETTGLSDLLQSVQYQLSGVDKLLDDLISEGKTLK